MLPHRGYARDRIARETERARARVHAERVPVEGLEIAGPVERTGLGRVPDTLRWGQLIGGAGLSGIGFTVALFVTELALDDAALVAQAKIGILAGSALAGVVGWLIFRLAGERGGQCVPSGLPVLPPRPWRPVE